MKKMIFVLLLMPYWLLGQTFTGTVADIRALSAGSTYETVFTTDYEGGTWNYDPSDLSSTDNTGTVLVVTSNNRRYKRVFDGVVNVKWFGLKGNDMANDRLAFNLMMSSGEKVLFFPRGIYRMDSAVIHTNDIRIYGEGPKSVIRRLGGISSSDFVRIKGSNVHISDMTFEDGGVSSKLIGVNHYIVDGTNPDISRNIRIENCFFNCTNINTGGIIVGQCIGLSISGNTLINRGTTAAQGLTWGITLFSGGSEVFKDAVVKNNTVTGFYNGIYAYGTAFRNNIQIIANTVKLAKAWGIVGYHCSNSRIEANKVDSCKNGIWGDSGADLETGRRNDQTLVSGNFIRHCDGIGIMTEELYNGVLSNNEISYCNIGIEIGGGSGRSVISSNCIKFCGTGVRLSNQVTPIKDYIKDITFIGNRIELNYTHGIHIFDNGIVRGSMSIVGNDIVNNGYQATDSIYAGLYIGDTYGTTFNPEYKIVGNTFGRNIGVGNSADSGNQAYGILIDTGASSLANVYIGGGNEFVNNTKAHLCSYSNNVLYRNNVATPTSRFLIDQMVNTDNDMSRTVALDFAPIAPGTVGTGLTVSIDGARTADNVVVTPMADNPGISYTAKVTSFNTVTVYPINATSTGIDLLSINFKVSVIKQ